MIPAEVLDEAIRTLDLLFSFGDLHKDAFLKEAKVLFWTISPSESPRCMYVFN
ncbi:hypothetical protein EJ02DRAFT_458944 [Clathrospora elynae]|uniref:Uncharacterized protein n=1 Tax=Clathrospora elynae TaxID=706981 RepID=A0A6A5SBY3_9PLEO|nr:hypothetical protein EJ02DRAFT_458944 [Clathrospora elynae]